MRLGLSLRTSLLAGIVSFGALSNKKGDRHYYQTIGAHLRNIFLTSLTCAQRTRVYICPRHWLLRYSGLYLFELGFIRFD